MLRDGMFEEMKWKGKGVSLRKTVDDNSLSGFMGV
jgi:hypothetical protein